jgi:hypothetical protein
MIVFSIYKLLHWLYGWGEITVEIKQILTILSAAECFAETCTVIGFCINNLPDILRERKRRKEQNK